MPKSFGVLGLAVVRDRLRRIKPQWSPKTQYKRAPLLE